MGREVNGCKDGCGRVRRRDNRERRRVCWSKGDENR